MKRIIISLVLVLAFGQVAMAQDINKLIAELAQIEGAEHQVVDRSMLEQSMTAAMQADSTLSEKAGFMKNIDQVDVVAVEDPKPEVREKFLAELNNFRDGNGYETMIAVKDDGDNVRIIAQRENGLVTAVIIFAIDDEDIAIIKMAGKFSESDLTKIIEEQQKNN